MSYHDGVEYDKDHPFAMEHLTAVTAGDIVRWFNFRAYGTEVPTENERPKQARSNSLYFWKKALSSFFPNKNHPWNEITNSGNPTRSQAVYDMIKKVQKFEVRGEGAPSHARRPLKEAVFRAVMQRLKESNDINSKYGVAALLAFQFHVIGRVDDCCKWKRQNLGAHETHPDKSGKARLAWSKNVLEERDAPWQHLFGCMDPIFCVILNLGLWLEVFHGSIPNGRVRPMVFGFSDKDDAEKAGNHGKGIVSNLLRPFFNAIGVEVEDFEEGSNQVGSHSIWKFASTWARSNGINKEDKDHQGRWQDCRVSKTYDDIQLDWIDARVAAVLCPGGVANYTVVDEACTRQWIADNVTPNIRDVFGNDLAYLFGKALLWLAFQDDLIEWIPANMRHSIKAVYATVGNMPNGPVRKRLVAVTGSDAQVYMEEIGIPQEEQDPGTNNTAPISHTHQAADGLQQHDNLNGGNNRQLLLSLMAQTNGLKRQITEQNNTIELLRSSVVNLRRTQTRFIRRYEYNPVVQLQRAARPFGQRGEIRGNNNARRAVPVVAPASPTRQADSVVDPRAALYGNVRDLHQMWQEWMHGIAGNKAAKNFTATERGRCKFKYSRRKIFWSQVSRMVDRGMSADQAIDAIYRHYGPVSPTQIISKLRDDRKNGSIPFALR